MGIALVYDRDYIRIIKSRSCKMSGFFNEPVSREVIVNGSIKSYPLVFIFQRMLPSKLPYNR